MQAVDRGRLWAVESGEFDYDEGRMDTARS